MMSGISGMNSMMGSMRPNPQQMFNRMDSDDSGNVDKDELSSAIQEMAERTGMEIDADSLMEEYDEDGDGVLSEDETQAAMDSLKTQMGSPPMGPPPGGPPPEQDGAGVYGEDGSVSESEIDQLVEALSEAEDDEDAKSIIQSWIQTLKGENDAYTPVDTLV